MDIPLTVAAASVPFSWSLRREKIWNNCPRRGFLHYYAARGGHDPDADPRRRKLHRLKQLLDRKEYIHRLLVSELLKPGPSQPLANWPERIFRRFHRERSAMLLGTPSADHGLPLLAELYFRQTPAMKLFDEITNQLRQNLHDLSASAALRLWNCRPPDQRLVETELIAIELAGVTLHMQPGFGTRVAGHAVFRQILSEEPDEEEKALLLLLHKYYAITRLKLPPENLVSELLLPGKSDAIRLDPAVLNLSAAIEKIQRTTEHQRRLLSRQPEVCELDFDINSAHCPECPFRTHCHS